MLNRLIIAAVLVLGAHITPPSADAQDQTPNDTPDYDLDCAVILCLVGGFPDGCADAWRYMIRRITAFPPKPPFGFCAMGGPDRPEAQNDDPAALQEMVAAIDDHRVRTSLQSVRGQVFGDIDQCWEGNNEDGRYVSCTRMVSFDGLDPNRVGWGKIAGAYRGQRIEYLDVEGALRQQGQADVYRRVDQDGATPGADGDGHSWRRPTYKWRPLTGRLWTWR